MFIGFKEVRNIHFIGELCYVFFSDDQFIVLNEVQAFVLKFIIEANYNLDETISYIKDYLQLEQDKVEETVMAVLEDLNSFIVFQADKTTEVDISGMVATYYPELVQISLTSKCYHRCKHCYKLNRGLDESLKYEVLSSFLNDLYPHTKKINLTGGEPFLYDHLEDLLNDFAGKFKFNINTCGFFSKDLPIKLYQYLDTIQVSLYGTTREEHDKFVSTPGSFDKVISYIKQLVTMSKDIQIAYQIKSNNATEIEQVIQLCCSLGVSKVKIGDISPIGYSQINNVHVEGINRNEHLETLRSKYHDQIEVIFEENEDEIPNNSLFFKCHAGIYKWHVAEDGRIVPCAMVDYDLFEMGNIYNKTAYEALIHENSYQKIQNKWITNKENIFRTYKQQGITTRDVCDKILSN